MLNSVQKYQQNAILTASPGELTLMLYNGAVKFCNQAMEAMEKKEVEVAHKCIVKTQNIMEELYGTLDDHIPLTKEIKPLYRYIIDLLIETNVKKDVKKLEEAKDLIIQFRDTWKEILKK